MKTKCICGLVMLAAMATARCESVSWRDFENLLGESIESPEVLHFVGSHHLTRSSTNDSGGFLNFKEAPFVIGYRSNRVSEVHVAIRSYGFVKAGPYQGGLPYGIHRGDTLETVIQRLGMPTTQKFHDGIIETSYAKLRMTLSFDEKTGALGTIVVYSQ